MSRIHAAIRATAGGAQLTDLGSTNGSFVNEIMVGKKPLKHRDKIRIGWNDFTFFDESAADFEETSEVKKSWIPGIYYSK